MMVQDPKLTEYLKKERMAVEKIQRQFKFAKDYQNIGVESPRWQGIKQIVNLMNDESDMGAVRITVTTGTASVCADPLFEKVIYNLFENALRHGGGVSEISVSLNEESTGAVLVVADNGIGIPANEKEKIFERGYGKNTGWGLFLVREILEITGMTITETGVREKVPGSRSTFPRAGSRRKVVQFPQRFKSAPHSRKNKKTRPTGRISCHGTCNFSSSRAYHHHF